MWTMKAKFGLASYFLILVASAFASQQQPNRAAPQPPTMQESTQLRASYLLGPQDQITIQALHVEEFSDKPILIDPSGYIKLPLVGRVQAQGLTIQQLESEVAARLQAYIQEPQVVVNLVVFRPQPVSLIGAVNNPGVHQLQGRKTLFEMVSMAGGLKPEAGNTAKITRRREYGPIPLSNATVDSTGEFTVAEVNLNDIMEARNPEQNIFIEPSDVISVSRADMVYVIGDVRKAGGFVLTERVPVSVLQVLSLAEGIQPTAQSEKSKILRVTPGVLRRTEISVNLKKILDNRAPDIALQREDILFVPTKNPGAKDIFKRTLESALYLGIGLAVYR